MSGNRRRKNFQKRMIFVKNLFEAFRLVLQSIDLSVRESSCSYSPVGAFLDSLNLISCTPVVYALEQIGIRTLIRFKSKMTRPVATNRNIIMFYRKAPFQQLYFIVAGAIWVSMEVPR